MHLERVVDLHALRCCTAALLIARDRLHHLTPIDIQRINVAIERLHDLQPDLGGELADTIVALLSRAPDRGGVRTVTALEQLARLVRLDDRATYDALAASITGPPVHPVNRHAS